EALGKMYSQAAANPGSYVGVYQSITPYGVPIARGGGISPRIISSEPMVDYGSVGNQMRRFGYTTQEMAGIYGFAFGSLRQGMGWDGQDFNQTAAMLQPASQGYSSARAF